jgi:FixH
MNWGKSIVLAFIIFTCFVGYLVSQMLSAKVDLVAKNYYPKAIQHQQQLLAVQHAAGFCADSVLRWQANEQVLWVHLPAAMRQGQLVWFRPSDQNLDQTIPLRDSLYLYSTRHLAKGLWRVSVKWSDGQRAYFLEKKIYL